MLSSRNIHSGGEKPRPIKPPNIDWLMLDIGKG
jgi:hypothetical protein